MPQNRTSPLVIGLLAAVALAALSLLAFTVLHGGRGIPGSTVAAGTTLPNTSTPTGSTTDPSSDGTTTTGGPSTTTTTTTTVPQHLWVDRRTVGQPWGDAVQGLLTFRGNPTNSWYGTGPVPATPEIKWRYPDAPMCSQSTDLGITSTWCGNGWTGQPVIWERPDGVTEIIFGAYDRRLHFVDAATGRATRTPFLTGDLVKGTPTLDPDGYPLVYFGSRDNKLRIAALDRGDPVELWSAVADLSVEGRWNDDWDGAPRIVNDIMFEGGENSIYYIWKLNRSYDAAGLVTVEPQLLFSMETWNDELLGDIQDGCTIGARCVSTSVESTTAIFEGRAYFGTSAGRVVGLDITNVENGEAPIVFDYWVGDDVDASIVVDEEGMLYVPVEWKRYLPRGRDLGQLIKLDPYTDGDPYVWGVSSLTDPPAKGGLWATPALGDGVVYAVTNKGYLVAVDREAGEELWVDEVGAGSWSSPVVVDGHLVVATNAGYLRCYDLTDPASPAPVWEIKVGEGSIEATPAVWKGMIFIGVRDGFMYAIGD